MLIIEMCYNSNTIAQNFGNCGFNEITEEDYLKTTNCSNTSNTWINQNELLGMSIYPNPTSNEINIDSEATLVDKIEVLNLMGEILIIEEAYNISKVNIGILPKGMYLVNLFSNGKLIQSSKILRE